MRNRKRGLIRAFGAVVGLLVLIQLVPYGRAHSNPPVTGEPAWDDPVTRQLFFRTCADCHSNETRWPWYSHVAPVSWLVGHDVGEGREHFNVSEWGRSGKNEGEEAAEQLREGEMPLWFYVPLHPEARLSAAEERTLIAGLVATFGDEGETGEHGEGEHGEGEHGEGEHEDDD